ncbi:hypothetical protein ACFRAR_34310 [Kitasatospora sp. NPDC056651]|uniref:hypothetical protein n=1 Tax=Kitasatospora sp. NPDC056651 TaxID=3345892 RepID=UPI0036AD2EDE
MSVSGAQASRCSGQGANPFEHDAPGDGPAGPDEADCDLWIDRLGRMVRGARSTAVAGQRVVTKEHYSDFGPAETFTPPADR